MNLVFDKDNNIDRKVSEANDSSSDTDTGCVLQHSMVDPTEPFRSKAIPELIYKYWGLMGRDEASIFAALDEFRQVPANLIALVCNAVSARKIHILMVSKC